MPNLTEFGPVGGALAMSAAELVADAAAKSQRYWVSVPAYAGLGFMWTTLLKNNPLGLTNLYWNAMTNWGNIVVGAWFGEQLSSSQYIGAILITAGILLLGQ